MTTAQANKPVHEGKPEPGYYRTRAYKGGPFLPVAIWKEGEQMVCRVGAQMADVNETWLYCADKRVPKADAMHAFETGRWPDEPPPIQTRSNMPSDPFEALKVEIDDKQAQAEEWLKAHPEVKTQQDANLARNMQAALLGLNERADEIFEAEKRPIRQQGKAVDDKFRFRQAVADVAVRLRKAYERFLVAEENRQKAEAEAKLKAEQERVLAERQRLEADRATKVRDDPVSALTEAPPQMPELPLVAEPVKIQAGGGVGRKAGLKDNWIGIIEDYPATLAHFAQHPDVRGVVEKLVKHVVKDAKGSCKIPGVKIKNERVAA